MEEKLGNFKDARLIFERKIDLFLYLDSLSTQNDLVLNVSNEYPSNAITVL
jgi:hypothetical protein